MQREITNKSELLDEDGELKQKGWARDLVLTYNRENIAASSLEVKEWDYYAILNREFGIAFTVADLGYIGLIDVVWLDFQEEDYNQDGIITLLPRGNYNLPRTSGEGKIKLDKGGVDLEFFKKSEGRELKFDYSGFDDGKGLTADLKLFQEPDHESITIVSDWVENPKRFYYNQKINNMPTEGTVETGGETHRFEKDTSFGVLDWGRGVWTYENTWYWGSASTKIDDTRVGWNLGYGFSDRSHASENAIFYDGKVHKLDRISFHYDENNYLKPWKITSNDDRFEMEFKPIMDRNSKTNLLFLKTVQHQVFGYYSGFFVLDNGEKIKVDNVLGFAEEVYNRW